ncbi:MAG: hypothetical protein ACRD0G_12665 [Acidimicrobiales bacterium]
MAATRPRAALRGLPFSAHIGRRHPAIESIIAAGDHIVVVASVAELIADRAPRRTRSARRGSSNSDEPSASSSTGPHASAGVAYFGVAYFGFVDTGMVHTTLDDDALLSKNALTLPRLLRRRITPQQAANVIADGIAPRALAAGVRSLSTAPRLSRSSRQRTSATGRDAPRNSGPIGPGSTRPDLMPPPP